MSKTSFFQVILVVAVCSQLSLSEGGGGNGFISLRDYKWADNHPWINDFEYERIVHEAQRQSVVGYSMEMKRHHLQLLAARNFPWVFPTPSADENLLLGLSHGWSDGLDIPPQPLYGYMITDPSVAESKLQIVLVGGNHPREPTGCWALHGMVDFLVSEDPRAEVLRRHAIFYVYPAVNPDGKMFMESEVHRRLINVNGSPELAAAGYNNHNRVWDTDGEIRSIDIVKAALLKDTGGRSDYLLDFHGIPRETFVFACDEVAPKSPLSRALGGRELGMTQRTGASHPGMLRTWSMSEHGLRSTYAFTPEIANSSKEKLFLEGRFFALAFYDVVTGQFPDQLLTLRASEMMAVKPVPPMEAWLFEGDARPVLNGMSDATLNEVEWLQEVRFEYPDNQSIALRGGSAFVAFDSSSSIEASEALTVSLWVRGDRVGPGLRHLVGRYNPAANQRSWTLAQREGTRDMLVILSSDGSHEGERIKRSLSALWPFGSVFDGTWRHVAFTFQGGGEGELRLFVDGVELLPEGREAHVFNVGAVPALYHSDAPFTIGYSHASDQSFEGLIDELAIWGTALSPEEIRWLASNSVREVIP